MTWRSVNEIPQAAGWYRVRRIDDDPPAVKMRAWGNGHWWIPLKGGWLSSDGVYEWESLPVCGIADSSDPIDPIEEMKRAEQCAALQAKEGA